MKNSPMVCLFMKTQFLVCVLFYIVPTKVAAGVVNDIPTSLQVILDSTNSRAFFTKIDRDHAWNPSLKQAQESLLVIQAFLEKSTEESNVTAVLGATSPERRIWIATEIKKILANKRGYRVQFWGDTRDGKKVVTCNFFPTAESKDKDEFPNWRKQEAFVDDGGYYFWQVAYDPVSKTVINFDSNGYARNNIVKGNRLFASFEVLVLRRLWVDYPRIKCIPKTLN